MPKMKPQIFKNEGRWWLAWETYGFARRVEVQEIDSQKAGFRELHRMHATGGFGDCPSMALAGNWDRQMPREGWGYQ